MTRMALDQTLPRWKWYEHCLHLQGVHQDGNLPEQVHLRPSDPGTPHGIDKEGCTVQLDTFTREAVQHNQASNIFHCNNLGTLMLTNLSLSR